MATLVAAVLTSASQIEGQSRYHGFRAGFVEARQVDEIGASNALPGFAIGWKFYEEKASWIGWQTGLTYTQKGWRQGTEWLGLDYLEAPVLLRLGIPRSDENSGHDIRLQPFMLTGTEVSWLVRCSRPDLGSPNTPDSRIRGPFDPQFPNSCSQYQKPHADIGWTLGGGLTLRRASRHFTIEVRRTSGLLNLGGTDSRGPARLTNVANTVAFEVGFKK